MIEAVGSYYFTEEALREWSRIAEKHRLRDEQFLRKLERWFRPGSILELGAATGHLSAILRGYERDVTASDVSPRFVAACAARGLKAQIVDARSNILKQTGRTFANVLAQGVLPLIRRDDATVFSTFIAIHEVLEGHGRLLCVSPHPRRAPNPEFYLTPHEQIEMARSSGLFRIVIEFPHQVVPTSLYRRWNAPLLNFLDFHAAKLAAIRVVWVAEKIG